MENNSLENKQDDLSKEASDKIEEIKKKQKELEKIQAECKHTETNVKNAGPEKGSHFELVRICSICKKLLGPASPDEINKWLEK